MIPFSFIKSVVAVAILVMACRFMSDSEFLLIIAQTVFSSYILRGTIMLIFYKLRLDSLYNEGYTLLITSGLKGKNKNAFILSYSVEYEAIKAHYKIRLSERIYKKNNELISKKWEQIKLQRESRK